MTWPRATRNLKHADPDQLTAMRDAAAALLEHERHISPDLITSLCQIKEETGAELMGRDRKAASPGQRLYPVRPSRRAAGQFGTALDPGHREG